MSPVSSPRSQQSPEDEFRHSIHSAWDLGARRGRYAPLEHERHLDLGDSHARDLDTMSLDSLQMRDPDREHPHDRSFTTAREIGRDEGDPLQTPAPGTTGFRRAPTNVRIERHSWPAVWLLIMSVYSTVLSGVWLVTAVVEPRWGSTISTNGPISLSTASLLTTILAKTIELSFVTVSVAFIGQVLTRRAIATHEGMTLAEMTMRTWITVGLPPRLSRFSTYLSTAAFDANLGQCSATRDPFQQRQNPAVCGSYASWYSHTSRNHCYHVLHHGIRHNDPAKIAIQQMA